MYHIIYIEGLVTLHYSLLFFYVPFGSQYTD